MKSSLHPQLLTNPSKAQPRAQEKGQVSIFLAFAFVIMFTLFGMTIHVGMVVSNKINIQNSADFASIYVAQRQAELLDAMGHINYLIRQSYKLMAFRYRVLGTLSRGTASIPHPVQVSNILSGGTPQDRLYSYARPLAGQNSLSDQISPCIFSKEVLSNDPSLSTTDWCNQAKIGGLRTIPSLANIYGLSINSVLSAGVSAANTKLDKERQAFALVNWWFSTAALSAFRVQQAYYKLLFWEIAKNLALPIVESGGMKDLRGESVYLGAEKTFKHNLSTTNSLVNFNVTNSLQNFSPDQVKNILFPEIQIFLMAYYSMLETNNVNTTQRSLTVYEYPNFPNLYADAANSLARYNNGIGLRDFAKFFNEKDDVAFASGIEKNPWYMIYNQVHGETNFSGIFSLGSNKLKAKAYSKPFGGSIGPWYYSQWPSGSNRSLGGQKTDLLAAPRRNGASPPPSGSLDASMLPNYSRYPGDQLGMASEMAQSMFEPLVQASGSGRFSTQDMRGMLSNLFAGSPIGTSLSITNSLMRRAELHAISPDMFDITHYNIQAYFYDSSLKHLQRWVRVPNAFTTSSTSAMAAKFAFSNESLLRGDLNMNFNNLSSTPGLTPGIEEQLKSRNSPHTNKYFYLLNDQGGEDSQLMHLLTSWTEGSDVNTYLPPTGLSTRFGKCSERWDPNKGHAPYPQNACLAGGRSGYSVKMISEAYLFEDHEFAPGSKGPILNPPN